ncbi:MAG: hypothetical protein SGCHY_004588, partial [Lobulomycetales sp.]
MNASSISLCGPRVPSQCFYLDSADNNLCLTVTEESMCPSLCSTRDSCSDALLGYCLAKEGSVYTLSLYQPLPSSDDASAGGNSTLPDSNATMCTPFPVDSLLCDSASCALSLARFNVSTGALSPPPNPSAEPQENSQQIFLYLILPLIALAVTLPCIFLKLRSCFRTWRSKPVITSFRPTEIAYEERMLAPAAGKYYLESSLDGSASADSDAKLIRSLPPLALTLTTNTTASSEYQVSIGNTDTRGGAAVRIVAPLDDTAPGLGSRRSSLRLSRTPNSSQSSHHHRSSAVSLCYPGGDAVASSSLPAAAGGGSMGSISFLKGVSCATVYAEDPPV